jgi:RNA polymerase sigma factor (sigma-70 family)
MLLLEQSLVTAVLNEDRKAQIALYNLCFPVLIGMARRFHANEEDQVTLVNNAFMKILKHLPKFDDKYFESWIRKIIKNEIIDDFRRNKKYKAAFVFVDNYLVEEAVGPEIDDTFSKEYLQELLYNLSAPSRAVFNLHVIEGYAHKEIGTMLGISEQTSKWHVKIARKKLRELLTKETAYENR